VTDLIRFGYPPLQFDGQAILLFMRCWDPHQILPAFVVIRKFRRNRQLGLSECRFRAIINLDEEGSMAEGKHQYNEAGRRLKAALISSLMRYAGVDRTLKGLPEDAGEGWGELAECLIQKGDPPALPGWQ
jgi:hypothetical protein